MHGSLCTAAGQSRRSSPGGPGKHDEDALPVVEHETGAVPAIPITTAPSGTVACFVTPAAKSAYGRLSRSATAREMPSIWRSSSPSTRSGAPATRATQLDRAVVVGRPEPARDEADVGGGRCRAECRLELDRVVAHDRDLAGTSPSASASRA